MTVIYGLIFMAGLLTGGVGGWLLTSLHYEHVAAEDDEEELEVAEFQELYAVWATRHHSQRTEGA